MVCIMDCCSGECGQGIDVHVAGWPVWGVAGFSFALVSQLHSLQTSKGCLIQLGLSQLQSTQNSVYMPA